ncbi:MAG: ribosome silencing factor [Simkaniaceae bacterium]|nr:ribosome silencing factor [Candidatus Sacchlamyda saccharinae]
MPKENVELAAQTIFDKKGINILALDVKDVSSLTDYVLIAEGNVDRHVVAIAKDVIDVLKNQGERPIYVDGLESGDWVVIDYLDYMIHIFMPGLRDKYQLEEMFRDGKILELNLKVDN